MWLIIPIGFYSIVHKDSDENELTIRSRSAEDLILLRDNYLPDLGEIVETKNGDYRFRSFVSKESLQQSMKLIVQYINYDNVKAASMLNYPERSKIYMDVWDRLGDIQHW